MSDTLNPDPGSLPQAALILAFDFGLRNVGVAQGNTLTRSCAPLKSLVNNTVLWAEIDQLFNEWQPAALVVGLPVHMDGKQSELTSAAKSFALKLQQRTSLPVFLQDERLSSVEAEHIIKSKRQQKSAKKTRSGDTDKLAASIILQRWFDEHGAGLA